MALSPLTTDALIGAGAEEDATQTLPVIGKDHKPV
jgi:hypothetical protein